ncbi:MAG TPA: PAS domain S-box protein [Ktedonobacterales bacterium]|jgi:PAS domain S-box-containing protein|nr:PAS domain S-box protein [Ktedonobacterales bacterium]
MTSDSASSTPRLTSRERLVLETAAEAMVLVDAEGHITCVNRQAATLFGYRRRELANQPLDVLIPAWSQHAEQLPQRIMPHGRRRSHVPEQLLGRRQDGRAFPLYLMAASLPDSTPMLAAVAMCPVRPLSPDSGHSPDAVRWQERQAARSLAQALAQVALLLAAERQNALLQEKVGAAQQAAAATAGQMRALQALTDTALAHLDLDDLLPALLDRVRDVLAVENATVLLLAADGPSDGEGEGQHLRVRAARGPGAVVAPEVRVPVGVGFAGRIAATRQPLIVEDMSKFPVVNRRLQERVRSAVGVPLLQQEQVLGVLHVSTTARRQFTQHEVELLQRVAERVTVAIERARHYEDERRAHAEADAARAAAERQAEELDRIFEQLAEGLIVYDAEGGLVRENAAARRMRGADDAPAEYLQLSMAERLALYGPRDAEGRPLAPEDIPPLPSLRGEVLTGDRAMELRLRTPDGRDLELRISAAPLRDGAGRIVGAVASGIDLTERNRLVREREAALVASEAWFHSLADTAPVLVWVSGTDGLVTFVNLPWLQFTGRTLEQELGDGWAEQVHPDDYARCLETYRAAFRTRESFTMEYRLRRADGEYRWLVDTGVPRFASDGTFLGYIGSAMDISERHQLEREREEARASELALREVNARLDTFVAMAAHDLRAPVTASQLTLQIAQRQLRRAATGGHPETGQQAQAVIRAGQALATTAGQIGRLARMVQQLLDVERVRAGTFVLNRQPVDLVALVRSSVEEQRLLNADRVFVLDPPNLPDPAGLAKPETDPPAVVVDADADRLGQVLTNYLANAVRYAPQDQPVEVRVQVVGGEPDPAQAAYMDGGRRVAKVEVRDHGLGIAPEDQANIWDRFQRARSVCEAKGGLGLGLYIARTIIEQHGGRVGVESALGQGSCFWFELPLACLTEEPGA